MRAGRHTERPASPRPSAQNSRCESTSFHASFNGNRVLALRVLAPTRFAGTVRARARYPPIHMIMPAACS
ncbi:hypothetical protein FKP32DRAFT_1588823 [Trametes sanguinea]|nr:hypothetical protein FKP32DRAFT_1588823 [Trametes sanguinea]